MSRLSAKPLALFLPFLCLSGAAVAQSSNKENAPYSRYGIGELLTGTNTAIIGMGFATTAYNNPTTVNSENPASLAFLRFTSYEAGATFNSRTIKSGNLSYSTGSASLAYLNIGVPLGKRDHEWGGLVLGLKPQSHVYYHTVDSTHFIDGSRAVAEYTGEGGLNYAYIGGAAKYHGFALGASFGYMFGTINNTSRLNNFDTTHVLSSDFSTYTKIGGIYWKTGLQYVTPINKKIILHLGATATISQNLNASQDRYASNFYTSSGTTYSDTAVNSTGLAGKLKLPLSYSFGAGLAGTNWALYADASAAKWEDYRLYDNIDSVTNTARINIGGEYTPDPTALRSYLSRVTYRLGFFYASDYVKLHGTEINYYGITAGASFPFRHSIDRIHIALEGGTHGTESNNLVRETFFKFHLGFTLNDKWFIKRKYD